MQNQKKLFLPKHIIISDFLVIDIISLLNLMSSVCVARVWLGSLWFLHVVCVVRVRWLCAVCVCVCVVVLDFKRENSISKSKIANNPCLIVIHYFWEKNKFKRKDQKTSKL